LTGADGKASLVTCSTVDAQLLVWHFMFDPSWDEGCPSCSLVIGHIGYQLNHLYARNTSLVATREPV
jgi:predicted dithiol-disulfide oxidoreductase (DUF899 family)